MQRLVPEGFHPGVERAPSKGSEEEVLLEGGG